MTASSIALVQANPVGGDVEGNLDRLEAMIGHLDPTKVRLAVTSELAVVGYPPRDLLDHLDPDTILTSILSRTWPVPVLFGTLLHGASGRPVNGAILVQDGAVLDSGGKRLLPTYDVFDERRYFEPDRKALILEDGLGVTICEDLWVGDATVPVTYPEDPLADLEDLGLKVLLNLSASPYHAGKPSQRMERVRLVAARLNVPVLLTNQVGGMDDLLFDGRSLVAWPDGTVRSAPAWCEGVLLVEPEDARRTVWSGPGDPLHGESIDMDVDRLDGIVLGLRDYGRKVGLERVLLGVSGGIDSAVCASIATEAFGPDAVLGVAMPSRHSSDHSLKDAETLCARLGIPFEVHPIEPSHDLLATSLAPWLEQGDPVAEENLQSRLRGLILMSIANAEGRMVIATGNKSEIAVGYCTLYGDMAGGYAPIGDLWKGQVRSLADAINARWTARGAVAPIPSSTLTKAPSAELAPGQTDAMSLPPYPVLDAILEAHIEHGESEGELIARGFDRSVVASVLALLARSEHKRLQMTLAPRVSPRAFGQGWRYPIAARR